MGCDIHLYTEVKDTTNNEKRWRNCDDWRLDKYYGVDPYTQQFEVHEIYGDRNYNLFGYLAGVRDTSVEPISQPRGLPTDVSKPTLHEHELWNGGGHSHSYLSFSEIENFRKHNPDATSLDPLLEAMTERLRDEMWISRDAPIPDDKKHDFRIVFWFDN